jgi:hypothetical protein
MYKTRKCYPPSIVNELTEKTPIILSNNYNEEKVSMIKRARTFVNGRYFHMVSILLTGFAVICSTLIKFFLASHIHQPDHNHGYFPKPDSMSQHLYTFTLFMIAVYMMILFWFCGEILLRMSLNGKYFFWREAKGFRIRNFFELLIIFGDTVFTIIVVGKLALHMNHPMLTFFGCLMPVRFAVYLLTAPPLHALIRGIKRAAKTIIFVSIFSAILIYVSSLISHILFGPVLNPKCEVCVQRFGSVQATFYSVLQVISCDTWVGDIVQPLVSQSIYSRSFIWAFFGVHVFIALFIFLNIFTAVICEGILRGPEDGKTQSEYTDKEPNNYRILRELFCGVRLLSEYVAKKQVHPDDQTDDIEIGTCAVTSTGHHGEVMAQFAAITVMMKNMAEQMEEMKKEIHEYRYRATSDFIPIPEDVFTHNSV